MNDWIVSTSTGAVLIAIGGLMLRSHGRTWDHQKNDPDLEPEDRVHYHRRYRRRMQTSSLILILGILIPAGDLAVPHLPKRVGGILFAAYVLIILLLALWVMILGLSDFAATAAHSRRAMARLQEKQRELNRELAEIRNRHANGHHPPG